MTAKTRTALTTEISTNLADNTTNAITPALERAVVQDINDSAFNVLAGDVLAVANGGTGSTTAIIATGAAGQVPVYTGTATIGPGLLTDAGSILYYGLNGVTTPALQVATTSAGDTLVVTQNAAGNGTTISSAGAGGSVPLTINTKGSGTLFLQVNAQTRASITSTTFLLPAGTTLTANGPVNHNAFSTHAGGTAFPTRAVTAATTTAVTDFSVFCNGTFTVTLHTPTNGQFMNIKNTGSGTITISGTIDVSGTMAAGVNLQIQYDVTGATWRVL